MIISTSLTGGGPALEDRVIRCRVCGRRVAHRRRDWRGRCRACRSFSRRTGAERPYVLDGRREKRGQLVFAFALEL